MVLQILQTRQPISLLLITNVAQNINELFLSPVVILALEASHRRLGLLVLLGPTQQCFAVLELTSIELL